MPKRKWFSLVQQAISATAWQPTLLPQVFRGQLETIGYFTKPVVIITALTTIFIQQLASYIGVKNFASIIIFQFMQTTFSAAITNGFPLSRRHLAQWL